MPDQQPEPTRPATLSPADALVLDAVLASLSEPNRPASALPPQDSARAQRVTDWLNLLDQCPAEPPPADLLQRTLARVHEARQTRRFAQQVQALTAPPVAFRWHELFAVAAVLLIAATVVWPMLIQSRADARRLACADNLRQAGMAFGYYAADHAGMLPRHAVQSNTPWYKVAQVSNEHGPVQSNSAHLYLLARRGYIHPNTLACPENEYAPRNMAASLYDWPSARAVSYSYQNQYTPEPIRLERANIAILADKNPLFVIQQTGVGEGGTFRGTITLTFRRERAADSPSDAHGQLRGQNVLTTRGDVTFKVEPMLATPGSAEPDNIWLAGQVTDYVGTETPASLDDSFLVP
jgi:hypothetical protein